MATELLARMAGSRCQNSQVCFGATVKACESSMQWLAALQMLRQQEHLRMRPSTAVLSACIGACRGDWALGIFIAPPGTGELPDALLLCNIDQLQREHRKPGLAPSASTLWRETSQRRN